MTSSQTKNIYFARHGERIDWLDKTWVETTERRFDPPLSSYGLQQAHELGVYIATLQPRITHIYASPFWRTIQTAYQVATQLNQDVTRPNEMIKIRVEPGYGEYFLSDHTWNDHSIFRSLNQLPDISQHMEYFDQDYDSVIKADYYLQIKVETREHLRDRLRRVLQSTLDAHSSDCNILIVTHAATLIEGVRALATISREQHQEVEMITKQKETNNSAWDMSPIRTGVCSLTHIELINNKWTLAKNGLTSYLSKGEQNLWIFPDDASLYETSK